MPCLNGGSCFGSAHTYLCICPVNYSGALCENRLGICQENPCSNRGLCVETSLTSFECRCYFGYMGPTCGEQIPRNNSRIWSSLLPVHTRVLFDMLHDAYNTKRKEKSSAGIDNSQVDFLGLLTTNDLSLDTEISTTMDESVLTTASSETTENEYVIKAENIELGRIFSDLTTTDMNTDEGTDPTDLPTHNLQTDMASSTAAEENITATTFGQFEQSSPSATNDQEMAKLVEDSNSTVFQRTTETLSFSEETNASFAIDTESTAPTMEVNSFNMTTTTVLEYNETEIKSSTPPSPAKTTADSHTIHSLIRHKLCQGILSHIFPKITPVANDTAALSLTFDSTLVTNHTVDTLLSWLQKHLIFSMNQNHTSTKVPPSTTESGNSSRPLQRVHMDDVLYQINDNHLDQEH